MSGLRNRKQLVYLVLSLFIFGCGEGGSEKITETPIIKQNIAQNTLEYSNGIKFCSSIDFKNTIISMANGQVQHFNKLQADCVGHITSSKSVQRIYNHPNSNYDIFECNTYDDFTVCPTQIADGYLDIYYGPKHSVIEGYCNLLDSGKDFSNEQEVGGETWRANFTETSGTVITMTAEKIENDQVMQKISIQAYQNQTGANLTKNGHLYILIYADKCIGQSGFNTTYYTRKN